MIRRICGISAWSAILVVLTACATAGPVAFHPVLHVWGANAPGMVPDSLKAGSRVSVCGKSGKSVSAAIDSSVHAVGAPDWEWESYLSSRDHDLELAVSSKDAGGLACRTLDALPAAKRPSGARFVVDSLVALMRANEFMKDSLGDGQAECKSWSEGEVCFARKKNGGPGPIVAESRTGAHAVLSSTCSTSFLAISLGGREFLYARDSGCGLGLVTTRVLAFSGARWESKLERVFE